MNLPEIKLTDDEEARISKILEEIKSGKMKVSKPLSTIEEIKEYLNSPE